MVNYILRRLLIAFFMLIGIGITSFLVIKLPPGDYASVYEGYLLARGATQEDADRAAAQIRQTYGLDQPIPIQFLTWIKGIVTEGKFGYSFAYGKDVGVLIAERLPMTLFLALMCHAISTFVGVGIGIFVAPRKYGFVDNFMADLSFFMNSIVPFYLARNIFFFLRFSFYHSYLDSFLFHQSACSPRRVSRVAVATL